MARERGALRRRVSATPTLRFRWAGWAVAREEAELGNARQLYVGESDLHLLPLIRAMGDDGPPRPRGTATALQLASTTADIAIPADEPDGAVVRAGWPHRVTLAVRPIPY
jgi:hypothetical protein